MLGGAGAGAAPARRRRAVRRVRRVRRDLETQRRAVRGTEDNDVAVAHVAQGRAGHERARGLGQTAPARPTDNVPHRGRVRGARCSTRRPIGPRSLLRIRFSRQLSVRQTIGPPSPEGFPGQFSAVSRSHEQTVRNEAIFTSRENSELPLPRLFLPGACRAPPHSRARRAARTRPVSFSRGRSAKRIRTPRVTARARAFAPSACITDAGNQARRGGYRFSFSPTPPRSSQPREPCRARGPAPDARARARSAVASPRTRHTVSPVGIPPPKPKRSRSPSSQSS